MKIFPHAIFNARKTFLLLISICLSAIFVSPQGIRIDHTCADNTQIPDFWVNQVKALIKLHYAHTSHGGQLTVGIGRLANSSLAVYDARLMYTLQYQTLPNAPNLCIMDGQLNDTYITPDEYWENGGDSYTRNSLNVHPSINISMWSWCTQMDYYSEQDINDYLNTISQLEKDYPNVIFVYMTGNAQATGASGYNRYLRNEQVRQFCRNNNKVLFDFADLDSWYNGVQATYTYNSQQIPREHPAYQGNQAAHTTYLSCENKGRALWWMLARLAGWNSANIFNNKFHLDTDWDGYAEIIKTFGIPGDIPISGDWNGDGTTNYGVYRPSTSKFFLDTDWDGYAEIIKTFGMPGDIPISGDWNGDGATNYGVYRPSTSKFFLDTDWDGIADIARSYGKTGDIPITGDWNGDGTTNYGVYRPSTSKFFLDTNWDSIADIGKSFGILNDIPVTGDWNGDGMTNYGVYRPSTSKFFLDTDWDHWANIGKCFGQPDDIPLSGDWDGDSRTNYGIFRE